MSFVSTADEIRQQVMMKLRLDPADSDMALYWINLAYIDVAQRTGCVQSHVTVSVDPTGFNVPSTTGWITEVTVGGAVAQRTTMEEILRQRESGESSTGPLYAVNGGNRVELHPSPSASVVQIWQSDLPAELTASDSPSAIPEPFAARLLEAGALVEGARFKKDPLLADYETSYQTWMTQFTTWLTARFSQGPMRIRLRTPHYSFGGIQSTVADMLDLDSADETRIKGWINQAYADAAQYSGFYQGEKIFPLVEDAVKLRVDDCVLQFRQVVRVYSQDVLTRPAQLVRTEELLSKIASNSGSGGARYDGGVYAVSGFDFNEINYWPASGPGEKMIVIFAGIPDPLVKDSDIPLIPEPFGSKILSYGAMVEGAKYKLRSGETNPKGSLVGDFENTLALWNERFVAWLNRRKTVNSVAFEVRTGDRPIDVLERESEHYS